MAPPPIVDPEERKQRQKAFWTQFVRALFLGALASALIWIPGWTQFGFPSNDFMGFIFVGLPALKVAIAVTCMLKDYRGFGAGLLVSIPIGAAIYFASCLGHALTSSW